MKSITIYLGSKCNLSCPYCHRTASPDESCATDEFVQRLIADNIKSVKFMGGEPTLYMDSIKKIVNALPNAKFAICTNGLNLKEHIDYFRRHEFLICISFDGDKNLLRGYDPFTDLIDYPWIAVSTTIYHGNTDFKAIIKRFVEKERIIGRSLSFFPHIAHATSNRNDPYSLTMQDAKDIVAQYKEMVGEYMEHYYKYGLSNTHYAGMFNGLVKRYHANYEYGETYCYNKNLQKTDSKGRHFNCLYIREKELVDWQAEQQDLLDTEFPKCRTCPVYSMCGGACVKSQAHEIECYIYKSIFTWFKEEYEKWEREYNADR